MNEIPPAATLLAWPIHLFGNSSGYLSNHHPLWWLAPRGLSTPPESSTHVRTMSLEPVTIGPSRSLEDFALSCEYASIAH